MSALPTPNLPPVKFASDDAFMRMFEAAPVAMLVVGRKGLIGLANAETRRMLGYTAEELRDTAITSLLTGKHLEVLRSFLARFWENSQGLAVNSDTEFLMHCQGGRETWVQLGFNPVTLDGALYALGAMVDVAARKRAEQGLRESEEKFSRVFRSSPDAISVHNMDDGRCLDANEGCLRLFGYTRAELIGERPMDLGIWANLAEREAFVGILRAHGSVRDFFARVRLRSGEIRVAQMSADVVEIGGRPHNVTVLRDMTEKLEAEKALRESEEKFSKAFRASPDAISVSELTTGRFLDVNEGYERLSGYSRAELIGRTSAELAIWSDPGDREKMLAELAQHGSVRNMEVKALTHSGKPISFLMSAEKVEIGGRSCLIIVSRDITARLQAEQALRESEEKFAKAFQASPDAIAITDLETGRYIEANGGHEQIFGFTREEVVGRTTLELGYYRNPEDREKMVAEIHAHGSVKNLELGCYKRYREPITVLYSGEAIEMNGRKCLVSVIHDITDRKQAEEALRRSETRFRSYFESPFIGMAITSTDMRWLEVNDHLCRMLGYSRDELLGTRWTDVTVKEDLPENKALIERAMAGTAEGTTFEKRYLRKDGSMLYAKLCTRIFRREDGTLDYFLAVIQDVTEQHEAEAARARLESQLRQTQKLEALGTLAGGIAHDFNNILTAIIVYRELAVMDIDRTEEVLKHLSEIGHASTRAKELVRQILTFSRQQKHERHPLRLYPVIKEALQLLRSSLPSTIEMELHLDEHAPEILADSGQIHQIVMNLATNAAHAMRDRPARLTVRLAPCQVDEAFCRTRTGLRPGLYAQLTVADTGHGMDEATLTHSFEPFYTTKAPGEGTGLGLAVVHGIMEDHEGAITVQSRVGEGTTFDLFFPEYTGVARAVVENDVTVPRGQDESVLLIDDELPLCEAIGAMLQKIGYRVTAVTNPVDAVARFKATPRAFDVVLTDHTMPHMTGLDVVREIHALRPEIPVLLLSGLSSMWTPEKLRGFTINEMVAKPLDLAGLAQAMRRTLGPPRKSTS